MVHGLKMLEKYPGLKGLQNAARKRLFGDLFSFREN